MMLLIILLLFPTSMLASSHQEYVEYVYQKLTRANGTEVLPIYVKAGVLSWCSMACTNGHRIVVTEELLASVSNEDELAGVIGHEMSHNSLHGESEMDADVQGLKYAQAAGYNYCVAAQILKRYAGDEAHPDGNVRYRNTGCR